MVIKIVIYSRNKLLAEGLKKLLEADNGFSIHAVVDDKKYLSEIIKQKTDIIIYDIHNSSPIFEEFFLDEFSINNIDREKILILCNNTQFPFIEKKMPNLIPKGVAGILITDDSDSL